VAPPRTTSATITGSIAGTSSSLLCYGTGLAKKFLSSAATTLANGTVGTAIAPKQLAHAPHTLAGGNPVYVAPGNLFPAPIVIETK
jgi:hypothetical protein